MGERWKACASLETMVQGVRRELETLIRFGPSLFPCFVYDLYRIRQSPTVRENPKTYYEKR
jgi:hypothetical protein